MFNGDNLRAFLVTFPWTCLLFHWSRPHSQLLASLRLWSGGQHVWLSVDVAFLGGRDSVWSQERCIDQWDTQWEKRRRNIIILETCLYIAVNGVGFCNMFYWCRKHALPLGEPQCIPAVFTPIILSQNTYTSANPSLSEDVLATLEQVPKDAVFVEWLQNVVGRWV